MANKNLENETAEYIYKLADVNGMAAISVSDGLIMVLTRQKIKELSELSMKNEKVILYIKHTEPVPPAFQN